MTYLLILHFQIEGEELELIKYSVCHFLVIESEIVWFAGVQTPQGHPFFLASLANMLLFFPLWRTSPSTTRRDDQSKTCYVFEMGETPHEKVFPTH